MFKSFHVVCFSSSTQALIVPKAYALASCSTKHGLTFSLAYVDELSMSMGILMS